MSGGRRRVRWVLLLPCAALAVMVYFFAVSLGRDPSLVPSPLIGRAAPEFSLPELLDPGSVFSLQDIEEGPWMLNVWASWCSGCIVEHDFLMALGRVDAPLYGLNWKDAPADALEWLQLRGNPYRVIAVDADGRAGIDWGVYGAPETFLIDAKGIVRHRHVGPLDEAVFSQVFLPVLEGSMQ
ncbi:MAG: DsbE family thiol:disulfide interchange protein [Gammaproteobacteria bacterium]|nr:DsbE family thiol:disulfide interchange protein [Gammaproteobacteria bacterium]MCY4164987.1 DsbE family thiol:disulfide interchange protein [Gammaproteobacteria bacterium]MCY4255470.1 DsbE family thiol:disulfide interchange protein [Gammaproteobacteria bacterium]MCY4340213.1 DsbE family thiol:disulfide interchange protein [Gammaproteobacteria bacterium]